MTLSDKLELFTEKLVLIQQKLKALEEDKIVLQTENKQLKTELEHFQNEKISTTKDILEHAEQEEVINEEGKRAALDQDIHQQIDHYINQIDHCIEWLRQQ